MEYNKMKKAELVEYVEKLIYEKNAFMAKSDDWKRRYDELNTKYNNNKSLKDISTSLNSLTSEICHHNRSISRSWFYSSG